MLKIAKDSGLNDVLSSGEKPMIEISTGDQKHYQELEGYPDNIDMSLYEKNDNFNPLTTSHPTDGGVVEEQVYLFNDENSRRGEDVTITATDLLDTDESTFIELSLDGSDYSSSVSLGDIDDTDGHVIYVRITTDSVSSTRNKSDLAFTVDYTEYAV